MCVLRSSAPPFDMSHFGVDANIHKLFVDVAMKGIRCLLFLDYDVVNVLWIRVHPADMGNLTNLIGFAYNQYLPRTIDVRVRTFGDFEQLFASSAVLMTSTKYYLAGKPNKPYRN